MNIGIVGSRRRNTESDKNLIRLALKALIQKDMVDTLVSGGCKKGADKFAEELAIELNLPIILHLPDMTNSQYSGKKGYAIACWNRNTLIANDSDILIAVVAKDRKGGTEDTIKKFLKRQPRERLILLEEI